MNTPAALSRASMVIATSALLVCASFGCASPKPPVSPPVAENHAAPAPPPAASPSPTSPTASNVSISDEILSRCGISDADAYFSFDSARVTSTDHTPLDKVAQCFTRGPLAGRSVKLVGRADPRGSSDYNLTLGQSRADAVGGYLDAQGMAKDKTLPTSRGSMDATGTDESSWQHDRRVDVLLGQ